MMSPYLVALICMSVVMCVMALLVGVLYALQAVSRRQAAASAGAVAAPALETGITPELVAVLAAAATAALGRSVIVRRINVLRPTGQENWSRVGRIDILRSHRMDQKR
jgi:Na+-transporting methylmalonyl-CoA/oxaloacetate decarboxylase gamma subunit